jgi:hypothetical protein
VADRAIATARAYGSPHWIGTSIIASARAFLEAHPVEALTRLRVSLAYFRQVPRFPCGEAEAARDTAVAEAVHGSRESGLELFEATIDTLPRGAAPQPGRDPGQPGCLFRPNRPSRRGCHFVRDATRSKSIAAVPGLPATVEHLRAMLGDAEFR